MCFICVFCSFICASFAHTRNRNTNFSTTRRIRFEISHDHDIVQTDLSSLFVTYCFINNNISFMYNKLVVKSYWTRKKDFIKLIKIIKYSDPKSVHSHWKVELHKTNVTIIEYDIMEPNWLKRTFLEDGKIDFVVFNVHYIF